MLKKIRIELTILFLLTFSVTACSEKKTDKSQNDLLTSLNGSGAYSEGICPLGHSDSIIPIVYGFPSNEMFEKSDSGLIALGGHEIEKGAP